MIQSHPKYKKYTQLLIILLIIRDTASVQVTAFQQCPMHKHTTIKVTILK